MSNQISPKYQMNIIQNINDKLYELFKSYDDVEAYVCKWQVFYDDFGNANFYIQYKDNEHKKIDLKKTLHQIDGETLLKIAIDLGLDTPDFIPSIPMFKNELKSSFETAAQTFEKAYCNVEKDPSLAIGLANSALESIIKAILKDKRVSIQYNNRDTLSTLIKNICKAFNINNDQSCPKEIRTIASSLISCSTAIEDLRSTKTEMYGKNLTFKTGGVDGCDCEETLRLIAEGKINTEPLITHTYPLSRIEEAYELFENKRNGVIKVAVEC